MQHRPRNAAATIPILREPAFANSTWSTIPAKRQALAEAGRTAVQTHIVQRPKGRERWFGAELSPDGCLFVLDISTVTPQLDPIGRS
jgi:hypothetical protein